MTDLKLPTLKEVDDKEIEYRRRVIDKNVSNVVEAMQKKSKYRNGAYQGSALLYGTQDTISPEEYVEGRIISELKALENSEKWSFRINNMGEIFWSSNGFPEEAPWWKIW